MPNILLTNRYDEGPLGILMEALPHGFTLTALERASRECLMEKIACADYLLVSGRLRIDEEALAAAKRLRMIQRTGVGIDMLDLEYIRNSGIPLYVNKGVNANSVAEHALMLTLAVLRKLPSVDADVRRGTWSKQATGVTCNELCGKMVVLVGMGSIGRRVAALLAPFQADVRYVDPFPLPQEDEAALGVTRMELGEAVGKADIISLHCPLNEQTKKMLGKEEFGAMKKGIILINTARGGLIDEESLVSRNGGRTRQRGRTRRV